MVSSRHILSQALAALAVCLVFSVNGAGQLIPAPPASQPSAQSNQASLDTLRQTYELAPDDQIMIEAPDSDELNNKPFRIDDDGTLTLPLVGDVKAAGLTTVQLEQSLTTLLKKYIVNPVIRITVTQFRSAPVFFVGEFEKPGVYALQGRHTLVEMLTDRGLAPTAGKRVKVTRKDESGPIPLPGAVENPATKSSSVDINLSALSEVNPAEDIVLQPYDVISVDKVEQVYTMGAFGKTGGYDVGVKESLPILQLLSMTGGLTVDAEASKAEILRQVLDTNRRAIIPLDLQRILDAKARDYPLLPGDILYVPHKRAASETAVKFETIGISLVSSTLIGLLINGRL
jgi:polysaccharide export outer membrane protein